VRRIDVSMPLRAGMPAFPGDPAFSLRPDHSIARGDAYNVSAVALGTHAGTHVDPPRHFFEGAATTDQLDLDVLNGPCAVVGVPPAVHRIGPAEVATVPDGTTRVLFRTSNSDRWRSNAGFFEDYVAVSPEGADALVGAGLRVVGIDALSIEADSSGLFPVHHRLLRQGVLIIEGLLLGQVEPGPYDLECMPLRIVGGDGGPARVALTAP
jgi:arylformamidase